MGLHPPHDFRSFDRNSVTTLSFHARVDLLVHLGILIGKSNKMETIQYSKSRQIRAEPIQKRALSEVPGIIEIPDNCKPLKDLSRRVRGR